MSEKAHPLRRGWTTGACATAATRAAYTALLTGHFPDPVSIRLPKGQEPCFALAHELSGPDFAQAGIIKDAGDDPDVTHGALIIATVRASSTPGVTFRAGEGVGTVTQAGLPIPVGEPAINPVPRRMICETIREVAALYAHDGNVSVEISVPDGARIALKTWNPRLGIQGGISILGTTGVVIPYSCSAWIHSIHRGVDVARANGLVHVAGCTGSSSESAVRALYGLPDIALLDMGDFAGGMLKYLRRHPVPRLTIGGGFGKLSKLARGALDLHSARSSVDLAWLCQELSTLSGVSVSENSLGSANAVLSFAEGHRAALAARVAEQACIAAKRVLHNDTEVDIVVVDRDGEIIGRTHA